MNIYKQYDNPKKNADHPNMKPIPLLCYLIKNSSSVNSILLDTFRDSGSTLIACQQMNRICFYNGARSEDTSNFVARILYFLLKYNKKIPYSEVVKFNKNHNINTIV